MRLIMLAMCLALTACASGNRASLEPADAATALITGGKLQMAVSSSGGGDDSVNVMTLSHSDGRAMSFEEANHAPNDVLTQTPGGPLAQVMGLFGQEQPVLYHARGGGAAFFCLPDGPAGIGVYTAANGQVSIVGLKSGFEVETRPDGSSEVLPFSPDHVCARMHFTKH